MSKRVLKTASFILMLAMLLPIMATVTVSSESNDLGVITSCEYEVGNRRITISGAVNHNIMIQSRDSTIALYRIYQWQDATSIISESEPIDSVPMSIRFDFSVRCQSTADRLAKYAIVIIAHDGKKELLTSPVYTDCKIKNPSDSGFKGVVTEFVSEASGAGTETAVVDVYLDLLESEKQNGYLLALADGYRYFDRDYVDRLDRKINTYRASGASVYLRFLVSADSGRTPSFAPKTSYGAKYRGVVLNSDRTSVDYYADAYFLLYRYRQSISSVIMGRGINEPYSYGYTANIGEKHYELYSNQIIVTALAAKDAGVGINFIVPFTDKCTIPGVPDFKAAAESIISYLSSSTDITLTLMLESTHNPYGFNDSMFETDQNESGDKEPGADSADTSSGTAQTAEATDSDAYTESTSTSEGSESQADMEPSTDKEAPHPEMNSQTSHYFAADILDTAILNLRQLSIRNAVSSDWIYCWYPQADTTGRALSASFAYSYLALSQKSANTFIVSFDDSDCEQYRELLHLYKTISSSDMETEIGFLFDVLGVSGPEKLFSNYSSKKMSIHSFYSLPLRIGQTEYMGYVKLWQFSASSGTAGWSTGLDCSKLSSVLNGNMRMLRAEMIPSSSNKYADICYSFSTPIYPKYIDDLTFKLLLDGDESELYEVKTYIYGDKYTAEAATAVYSGQTVDISADISVFGDDMPISAIRLCVRHISGDAPFELYLLEGGALSDDHGADELAELMLAPDGASRDKSLADSEVAKKLFFVCILVLISAAITAAVLVYQDKKRNI